MTVSNPFFSKREPQSFVNRPSNPVGGFRPAGNAAAEPAASTVHESVPSSMVHGNSAAPAAASASSNTADQGGSKLTVGPNIKLKGVEITDCDTLVVEGTVEATMIRASSTLRSRALFTVLQKLILPRFMASLRAR